VLTTLPFWVQLTKLKPLLAVAVTVTELPAANVPPPLTVPSALGEALTATVSCVALTVRVARRLWLLKLMLPVYVPALRLFALELIEKVTVVPDLVAVPDVDEAVSQFGTLLIE
jgi:hypothetical protein